MSNPSLTLENVATTSPGWAAVRSIRYQVFVEEQKVDEAEEYDEYETTSRHILAFWQGAPVGTARWRQTDKGFKLERFAVLSSHRGKGVGDAILTEVLAQVTQVRKPDQPIYLHAQVYAIPFYRRQGFVPYGPEFDEANILHQAMKWQPAPMD